MSLREEIYQTQKYPYGIRVDKQLMVSLEDLFKQYDEKSSLEILVDCDNGAKYSFDYIDECFDFFEKNPYRIVQLEMEAVFKKRYESNRITITFDNKAYGHTELEYKFDSNDEYLLLKNKIEMCLNNFRTYNGIVDSIPIMPILLTLLFIFICVYTNINDIVFPKLTQYLLTFVWLFGSLFFSFNEKATALKRKIFPLAEFRIGQNIKIEEKYSKIRNVIIGTVGVGLLVSILANFISSFLF